MPRACETILLSAQSFSEVHLKTKRCFYCIQQNLNGCKASCGIKSQYVAPPIIYGILLNQGVLASLGSHEEHGLQPQKAPYPKALRLKNF